MILHQIICIETPHPALRFKFDKLGHGLRGGSPIADISLYNSHIPGEPLNASGVDDAKLTEMIRLQRRTLEGAG